MRRPFSQDAATGHELLELLEAVGFEHTPRFLGLDERGRATLSFIDGEVPSSCGTIIWRDDQLRAAASG